MKLLAYALETSRHYSTGVASFNKKKWCSWFSKKKKSAVGGSKTLKKPRMEWTDEQKQVLDAVLDGKSVFITGSAGTGKTFLLETVIKELKKIHKRSTVYVTASTGVASCALNGQTLHSFAGIGFGDLERDCLLERVLMDGRALSRWKKAKALVIDEISMVDADLFDNLEYIARSLRVDSEGKSWGDLQLVVSGDFCQLPPVIKKKAKRIYAFEADCWSGSFDLQIELTKIFRQSDPLLVQMLSGIRKGEFDPDDLKLLEGCCSGYEPDPSAVRLFPRIKDVNHVNKEKLEALEMEVYVYKAEDNGEKGWKNQLDAGIALHEVELCVGARVMLVKNVNPWRKLVNGATGTVVQFCQVSGKQHDLHEMCSHGNVLPLVKFDSGLELIVEPETWVVMDGDKVVATRKQIPLILSWALSIHKCQGMTLDLLHTDLKRVFDYGMVYVALSRVRNLNGLSLSGLDPSKIKAHPKVLEFYRDFNKNQGQEDKQITCQLVSS